LSKVLEFQDIYNGQRVRKYKGANLRETLNHFSRTRRMPDTALAVISRDLMASISSMGRSEGSTEFGRGTLAGSLF
jgi:hypothetical protein